VSSVHFIYDGHGANWPKHGGFDASDLCGADHGLSGTELPMFGMAFELARMGHEVTVFSRFKQECLQYADDPTLPSGERAWHSRPQRPVVFLDLDYPHDPCDIAVAFHDGRPLDRWNAKKKVLLAQAFLLPNRQQDATYSNADFADIYITATDHVARHLERSYGWPKVHVVPNAWDLGTYHPWNPTPGRLIYTTSLERGFHRLLEAFPLIRAKVPEAHIVAFERGGPAVEKLRANPVEGVTLVRASSRNAVLEELSRAACFAYPCDPSSPTEVFPLSVLEACATGVPVVLAPADGIEKLFDGAVWLTPPISAGESREAFVDATCEALTNPAVAREWSDKGKAWADPLRFSVTTSMFCEAVGI
jgi:glycosyltransferase involved in cell wall biosynthesis